MPKGEKACRANRHPISSIGCESSITEATRSANSHALSEVTHLARGFLRPSNSQSALIRMKRAGNFMMPWNRRRANGRWRLMYDAHRASICLRLVRQADRSLARSVEHTAELQKLMR